MGETCAGIFLQRRGATVLGRNVRVPDGEIDLVVRVGGATVAVEVKTIVGDGDPLDRIDSAKRDIVYRSARALPGRIDRVDAIGVQLFAEHVAIRWVPYL